MEDMSSLAEAILEQMADAVIYADKTGTIRRWNPAAAALFGYSAASYYLLGVRNIMPGATSYSAG